MYRKNGLQCSHQESGVRHTIWSNEKQSRPIDTAKNHQPWIDVGTTNNLWQIEHFRRGLSTNLLQHFPCRIDIQSRAATHRHIDSVFIYINACWREAGWQLLDIWSFSPFTTKIARRWNPTPFNILRVGINSTRSYPCWCGNWQNSFSARFVMRPIRFWHNFETNFWGQR